MIYNIQNVDLTVFIFRSFSPPTLLVWSMDIKEDRFILHKWSF